MCIRDSPHPHPHPHPHQVIINDTSGNRTTAVRRVLGQDAIIAARILFGIAGVSGAILLYAVGDLVLSAPIA